MPKIELIEGGSRTDDRDQLCTSHGLGPEFYGFLPKIIGVMMKVVGIDPSLSCTALVALHGDRVAESKLVASKKRDTERLEDIRRAVLDFLDAHDPELVAIEGFAYNAKGASVFEMGGLGWLLRWALFMACRPYVIVPPSTLKLYATGVGNAPKEIVIREVFRRWQFEARDNNEADAYALARFASEAAGSAQSKKFEALLGKCEVRK